jgi:uncharacterized 2Fe-2S/4Fe-4S cluster protein (DUF4445 family)
MDPSEAAVTFQPQGKTVRVRPGTRLIEAALEAGVELDMPCGGEGVCGKCRVVLRQGIGPPGPAEEDAISAADLEQGMRLACQTTVRGPMTVEVPDTSLLASFHQIFVQTGAAARQSTDPIVSKRYVELPPPVRGDDLADLDRVRRALGPVQPDLDLLRELPHRLRQAGFCGTAVLAGPDLIDFEPGNTEAESFAVAVDVGTTTLVAMLVDLNTGEELAVTSRLNPQTGHGDDVLTRILYAQQSDAKLGELNRLVVQAIDAMIGELAARVGVVRERIYEATLSGNTTMQHLFCRIDPRYLGEVPFVPASGGHVLTGAARLGLGIHPRGRAYVLPVIGGFVGGDTVAGMLATDLAESTGPSLLVDIGTNGEIVLAADGKLWAAATAAGPAFEGARIQHGMRGSAGAIERVAIDGQLHAGVIGGSRPVGICGSGLIDLAAELLDHGVITPEGRVRVPDELPQDALPDVRRRVVAHDGQVSFLVAEAAETGTGKPIVLTQRDVRQLQLASGAIRAGVVLLLRRAGLETSQLEHVFVAGGFGNFIRRSRAQRIGLLPSGIPRERIRYQGNTSLAGARLVAVSRSARHKAETLAHQTEHIDLSTDPGFQWAFADAMIFPAE